MIKVTSYGHVLRYDLATSIFGRGRYWTTAYRVGDTLIDSGCAHTAGELLAELRDVDVSRILNTHSHEDHIGANGVLQRERPSVVVHAHTRALPVLADPRGQQKLHPYRRVMWGWPLPCSVDPVEDGDLLDCGERSFQVLHTPGHSSDHICLLEKEQGWLFTGDLYVGGRDRALRAGYDIWGIIDSLKRVASLGVKRIFPGSARVPDSPQEALEDKISHLEELGQRIVDHDRRGWSERQIIKAELGGPMFMELATLGHFSRRRLVRSYLGRNGEVEPLPVEDAVPS